MEVEPDAYGAVVGAEPVSRDGAIEVEGRLVIPASGEPIDDELVRSLRDAERRLEVGRIE